MSDEDQEKPPATFQGWFTRLQCGECEAMFDVEDDVSSGEVVHCDACGTACVVEGR